MALCKILMYTKQLTLNGSYSRTCFLSWNIQSYFRTYSQHGFRGHISKCIRNIPNKGQNVSFPACQNTSLLSSKNNLLSFRRMFMSSRGRRSNLNGNQEKNASNKISVQNASRGKLQPGELRRLIGLLKPEKWKLTGALMCLLISSGVSMAVPYFIGKIIDMIYSKNTGGEMLLHLQTFCLTLIVVFFIGGLANFGRVYILQTSSQRIVKRLREALFNRIIRQEIGFFDKTKTGELINRLSADTSLVAQSLSQNISDGLRAMFQATAGIGMMAYVSTKLTLIAMGIVPPVAVASIIYGRYLRKITKRVQDSLADTTHVAEEKISNIRTVKAFAHEDLECETYNHGIERVLNLSYQEALARAVFWGFTKYDGSTSIMASSLRRKHRHDTNRMRSQEIDHIYPNTGFSGNIIIISILYFGGFMMMEASISVGDLSSFLLYAAYVGASMGGLTTFYTELNRGIAASQRIWELIDRQPSLEEESSTALSKVDGSFLFQDVSFAYPSRPNAPIFSNLSMEIPDGKITALVGPSGSGKSTVGVLMLRFFDPTSGMITLDGHNIQDMDSSFLRSKIGVVSQEPVLFSSTIIENIAYGAPDPHLVSQEAVMAAAIKANAASFIQDFPQGFDTMVGQRGQMLSGGQRQRIAIARAIVKNPKILILDEATSALDAESEFLVQDALEQLMVGRTVLIIAHRLSSIMNADNILVIDKGRLVESGTYKELMMINGLFRKLVDRQTLVR